MAKTHRTAQGRQLDMESLRLKNELVPAIGNMRVNARGDQLGPGGKIVKTREQLMAEHYDSDIAVRKSSGARAKADDPSAIRARNNPDQIPTSSRAAKTALENLTQGIESGRAAEVEKQPVPLATAEEIQKALETAPEAPPVSDKEAQTEIEELEQETQQKLRGGLAQALSREQKKNQNQNKPKKM